MEMVVVSIQRIALGSECWEVCMYFSVGVVAMGMPNDLVSGSASSDVCMCFEAVSSLLMSHQSTVEKAPRVSMPYECEGDKTKCRSLKRA